MSTLALPLRQPSKILDRGSVGGSAEFRRLVALLDIARHDRRIAASAPQSRSLADLGRIAATCGRYGWDGYRAKPITQGALQKAQAILDELPMWLPAPDIVPEADGEIAIEWDFAPDLIFSISVGESSKLHYAGLFGGGVERHGVEPFDGVVSSEILGYIKSIVATSQSIETSQS
jgi:hypothetical protein